VNSGLARLAGEVGDGFHVHPLHSAEYIREVLRPAIAEGQHRSGRAAGGVRLAASVFVSASPAEREAVRQQIAFYASTPAYKPVLDQHGWGDLQPELNRMSKQGEWVQMGELIDDDVVEAFAVRGEPEDIPKLILDRYGDVMDRVTFYTPYKSDPDRWKTVLAGFKTGV
jgi:probable F420-dependent oxidoreductase